MDAMTSPGLGGQTNRSESTALLRRSAIGWFIVAALGQAAFVWMILAHYGGRTLAGNYAGWNDKPLIKGYVAGDVGGNLIFGLHVLLAAAVTVGGLLQLVPTVRRRAPALHRWIGRMFFTIAIVMAVSGLWLTWARHTYLSVISGVAVSVDGIMILACAVIAWRLALRRDFAAHRRWALRSFMAVNGVWFLRVGMMAWVLLSGGGIGMNDTLSGPADIVIQFGAYLVPLAVLEAYFRAQQAVGRAAQYTVAGVVFAASAVTAAGIAGAVAFMWWPYMH